MNMVDTFTPGKSILEQFFLKFIDHVLPVDPSRQLSFLQLLALLQGRLFMSNFL